MSRMDEVDYEERRVWITRLVIPSMPSIAERNLKDEGRISDQ